MIAEATLYFAVVALGLHLLTDARKLAQGLRLRHTPLPKLTCPRCVIIGNVAAESWWQVAAFLALAAHLASDAMGWNPW